MSQEPADPTASSAPPDGTPPTIPSPVADVQPDAGGSMPPPADPAPTVSELEVPAPADAEVPVAMVKVEDPAAPVEEPPVAVEEPPAAAEEPPAVDTTVAASETSATILAAVVAEPESSLEPPPVTAPAPEPEAAATGPEVERPEEPPVNVVAPDAPRRRGPWRTIGGVLLLLLLATALGFGVSFLVPGFVDVAAPSGAATPPAPSTTPASTATPSPSPRPSRSPSPSPSSGGSATPRSSSTIYIVQKGDILSAIAARFGVTVQAIVAANGLTDPNHIEPGQRLVIPPP